MAEQKFTVQAAVDGKLTLASTMKFPPAERGSRFNPG